MKDKIIDILKYVWNPKFDLDNNYEYQHLQDMAKFILDVLDDQRETRINAFLKKIQLSGIKVRYLQISLIR